MPISTTPHLVDLVRQFRLLDAAQLHELSNNLQTKFPNPQALAKELVQRGWLTPYQVNRLFQGKAQELVLGSYVLLEPIGEGGMGTVFKARHQLLDRIDAIKVIRSVYLANPKAVQRFHREAKAAARLSHANVITVYDAGQAGDVHFLAMEFVAGIDLSRLLKQRGALPTPQACDYIRQAALGLHHAHEKGLIHRDVKPSNLLLSADGRRIKVLDLGLARPIEGGQHDQSLTSSDMMVGTADYVAPEQARNSKQIDSRADLYSLGCSLYVLLTGKIPFPGETVTEKLLKHQLEEPAAVEVQRPGLPEGLGDLVRRMMAKRPDQRFGSLADVAEALSPYCGELAFDPARSESLPIAIPVAEASEIYSAPTVPLGQTPSTLGLPVRSRRHLLAIAVVLIAVAGLIAGGVSLLGKRTDSVALATHTDATPPRTTAAATKTTLTPAEIEARILALAAQGDALLAQNKLDPAIAAYSEAISLDPRYAAPYTNRGLAYRRKGLTELAIADFTTAIARDPSKYLPYFHRAAVYFERRDFAKSLADNSKAIEIKPDYAPAYNNRGTIYAAQGKHEHAVAEFTAALKVDPGYVQALNNRGNNYVNLGQYDPALSDFTRATQLAPTAPDAYTYRAQVYYRQGENARAMKDLEIALKNDPKFGLAYLIRSDIHRKLGNQAQSDADRKTANQLDPSLAKLP